MLPDGKTFYFFFTPDVRVPVEKQVMDVVTGIYVSRMLNGSWGKAERVFLQDPGKLAMDGAPMPTTRRKTSRRRSGVIGSGEPASRSRIARMRAGGVVASMDGSSQAAGWSARDPSAKNDE